MDFFLESYAGIALMFLFLLLSSVLFLLIFLVVVGFLYEYVSTKCPYCGSKITLKSRGDGIIEVIYCDKCKREVLRAPFDMHAGDIYGDKFGRFWYLSGLEIISKGFFICIFGLEKAK